MRDWDEADDGAVGRVGGGPETEPERTSELGTAAPRAPGWAPVRLLGAGAQAEVWLVEDGRGVRAALKVPRAGAAPDALAAEAQAGRVAHPHLLRVLGVVETDRGLGVLTEHRAAGTLQDMVQRVGPLSPGQAVTVLVPIAQALACLHREGVVHGDVSPANVLFGVDGSPALADLGVARVVGGASGAGATPGFAAPEALAAVQGAGAEPEASPAVGAPSDVHAWAALGWYALTGRAPGAAGHRAPLPVLVPEASPELALLLDAALSPDPAARPSAEEAAAAVYATARPEPVPLGEAAPAEVAHLLPTVLPGSGPTRRRRRRAGPGRRALVGRRGAAPRRGVLLAAGLATALAVGGGTAGLWWPAAPGSAAEGAPAEGAPDSAGTEPTGTPVDAARPADGTRESGTPARATDTGAPREDAAGADAVDVGEALAAVGHARTAALTDPEPARLDAYAVPGGPAWENDRDLLRRLTDEDFAFSGLEVTVEQAGPARWSGDDALRVDAVLRTSAHTVLDRAGRVAAHREATAEEVVLVLRGGHGEDPEARDGGAAGRTWRVETVDPR
ncbi:serine/threonine-protein kinase [Micrococcus luteus]|uniref:serine/threonine-protein kinase n=1 Tax=Micrococcus luteus TaxID=1270 RepID=UPI0020040343|nr:protein kinase [Micrococcus luteus]MCK6056248.1 protein kinase [Micrococcus luteus]MCK6060587.1 protein kinase [Micrococcus luteus]MCK6064184.1 protein kinase [Micrococcus luteus]MCK6191685.1 protein kinase [Micrococcus luteus]MCK6193671.1 protein kinase [Micrococcus luteus]